MNIPYLEIIIGVIALVTLGFMLFFNSKNQDENKIHSKSMIYMIIGYIMLLIVIGAITVSLGDDAFFKHIGATIIISWIVVLLGYYVWAIYFYNVNYGWQEKDWTDYKKKKDRGLDAGEAPERNPHERDSLGLPPGTIRGTISLTILVGGLAVTIKALSYPEQYEGNTLIVDHFEFFKEAFLMVIAFYFGTKGLEALQNKETKKANSTEPTAEDPSVGSERNESTQTTQRAVNFETPDSVG